MSTSYSILTGPKNTPGSIRYWVNWNKAPVESIVSQAESWVFQTLRCREMKTRETGQILTDATTMTLPNGWRGLIDLRLRGDYTHQIVLRDPQVFEEALTYETDGSLSAAAPYECTVDASTIYLNRKADQDYNYRMWYWKAPTALSETNETNFLTDRYEYLFQAACLYIANMHRKDNEESQRWMAIAMQGIEQANVEVDMEASAAEYEIHWGY